MDRIFNFRQSRELLRVDPKTFQKWLQKAEIDANKQVNLADSRERYLTEEQLTLLAKQHGRTLPPLNSQPELPATVTPAMLAEQLTLFEQEFTQHFKRLEAQGLQTLQIIDDLQRNLANLERTEGAADRAAQSGKITVESGKWLYNSRYITIALDQQGQSEFYAVFHEREGFRDCKECPHAPSR
jgi:hypothetical protein